MNLPNKLTVLRMVLAPLFLAAALTSLPHRFLLAAVLFAAASVTDFLDGRLARKLGQVTVFGQLIDAMADKLLITAALLAFLVLGWCNVWIVMIVLAREFLITSLRLISATQGVVIPANAWGKLKTASQMAFLLLLLLLADLNGSFAWLREAQFVLLSNALLGLTAVFTLLSGAVYVVQSRKVINFNV